MIPFDQDELASCCNIHVPCFDYEAENLTQRNSPWYITKKLKHIDPKNCLNFEAPMYPKSLRMTICERFQLFASEDSSNLANLSTEKLKLFSSDTVLEDDGFHDTNGPASLGNIFQFFNLVESLLSENADSSICLTCPLDCPALTNAIFLVGAYLMMKHETDPDELVKRLSPASDFVASFRNASPGRDDHHFHLYLHDCWAGLWRAKELGWVGHHFHGFDAAERAHFGSPLNGDMHEVVPGKFVAMRGPRALPGGALYHDSEADGGRLRRDLSPAACIDALRHFGVQAVVRLGAPEYDRAAFVDAGLGFADLGWYEDGAPPPATVVAKFMLIAEGLPGPVAVHCRAGLGRTGTLIALYMMQHCGFTARAAMGWLRIARPGSVQGPQQDYLLRREAVMRRTAATFRREGPTVSLASAAGPTAVARLIADATAVVDGRIRALRARRLRTRDDADLPPPVVTGAGARRMPAGVWELARCHSSALPERRAMDVDAGPGEALRYCADLLPLPTA